MNSKILVIAGARPNFMKIAPLMREFRSSSKNFDAKLVHTGQHYDFLMSGTFFKDLDIPDPDIHLGAGSGSHAEQTARIIEAFEKVCAKEKPETVIVVGDVNSTLACSLAASKLGIKVAHVEAGLRSFDRTMPEEINRVVTDALSDYLFVSEPSGMENLMKEGVDRKKVFLVGNIMIDTLLANLKKIDHSRILEKLTLAPRSYCVVTLHRPSNVDGKGSLFEIYGILREISRHLPIVYPIHPRALKMIGEYGLMEKFKSIPGLQMTDPLGYIDFIKLVKESRFVMTDSGGIQEESTVLGIPCLTMRNNTERPATVLEGTNSLVGRDMEKIMTRVKKILYGACEEGGIPSLWDGRAAGRIAGVLRECG